MSATGVSAAHAAVSTPVHAANDAMIAALQGKIEDLEKEIKQAKHEGDTEMVKLLLKDKTALQEKENLLLKSQSDAGECARRQ